MTTDDKPHAIILGCVSGKQAGPARAKDLYVSQLFSRRRRYAEATGRPWFIFSAKHGIVDPEQVIEWYDVALSAQPVDYRKRIGAQAAQQLEAMVGPLDGRTFEIHAGASYVKALAPEIARRGGDLANPVEGLQIGYLYQWYDKEAGVPPRGRTTKPSSPSSLRPKADATRDRRRTPRLEALPEDVPAVSISIDRISPGPSLVIEDAARFAFDFFRMDASAQPGGYDDLAGIGERNRITTADITAINTTMRARSPHTAWEPLTSQPSLAWLEALDPSWDLVEIEEHLWRSVALPSIAEALQATIGPGRGLSVATKVLHLKRPFIFPVLDSLVLEQLGATSSVSPTRIVEHLRAVGRRNLPALRQIQKAVRGTYPRSLVRILDVLLWASHPAAGLSPSLGAWQHVIRPATTREEPNLDARSHLATLIGKTIPTVTGEPNHIIAIENEHVIVGTRQSPLGTPVPIRWVQEALDRLLIAGELEISVRSVGYRSAFIGAVLSTIPGAAVYLRPARIVLAGL